MEMSATSWSVSNGAALLTPARPCTLQPGNNHIDWLLKEDRKMFWLLLSKTRGPRRELCRMCQASDGGSGPAPRTPRGFSSGLCLFIWKRYSPLNTAVKKRPLVSREAFVIHLALCHPSAWVTVPPFGERGALQPHESSGAVSR